MGVVYRGTDLRLGRPVAIKLIAADRDTEPTVRQRFEREARLMAAIDHPNVLPVYAAGEENGCLFLVMRYVAGTDLAALLRIERRLDPMRAARIAEQLALALDAAHAAGLVHRDIKPANVLLAGEHVYLSDFGIGRAVEGATKLTDSNDWLGTVDFCSPEQLRGERTDGRSDVYALGCLLHTLLTGTPPHHRDTAAATLLAHLGDDPPPPSDSEGVPESFDQVVWRALAKRPADRYATAGQLGRAALAAAGTTAPAAALGLGARRARPRRDPEDVTVASPTRTPRGPARTRLDLRPRPEPTPPARRRPLPVLVIAAAIATALVVGLTGLRPSGAPSGPLGQTEIATLVRSFAGAYGHRDARALGSLLAPDVTRVSAGAIEHGRAPVLGEYEAQFRDQSIVGYEVSNLQVQTGWVGRASGRYAVVRTGQADLSGSVTFGVERVAGHPMIGLITTQPAG